MNEHLLQLLKLQDIDRVIDGLKSQLDQIPVFLEAKQALIQSAKTGFESERNRLIALQLKKKEKEVELQSQEDKIRKHEGELNSVKSNEAYKALLSEIGNVRNQKSQVEDEILNVMEETDHLTLELKGMEGDTKGQVQQIESEIKAAEEKKRGLEAQMQEESKKRDEFLPNLQADVLSTYEYIRKKKKGIAIVYILGESCSGCNTLLTQITINEARKGKDLIRCDSCSRILVVPDQPPQPASPAPQSTTVS